MDLVRVLGVDRAAGLTPAPVRANHAVVAPRSWSVIDVGKYSGKGKTLPQIVLDDPDWFFWACEEELFTGALLQQAEEVRRRATSIRIPDPKGLDLVAEYLVHDPTQRFGDMRLVPRSRAVHQGSSSARRSDVVDLSAPRRLDPYDKRGGKMLVQIVKQLVGLRRLTAARCHEFFDADRNFVLK